MLNRAISLLPDWEFVVTFSLSLCNVLSTDCVSAGKCCVDYWHIQSRTGPRSTELLCGESGGPSLPTTTHPPTPPHNITQNVKMSKSGSDLCQLHFIFTNKYEHSWSLSNQLFLLQRIS